MLPYNLNFRRMLTRKLITDYLRPGMPLISQTDLSRQEELTALRHEMVHLLQSKSVPDQQQPDRDNGSEGSDGSGRDDNTKPPDANNYEKDQNKDLDSGSVEPPDERIEVFRAVNFALKENNRLMKDHRNKFKRTQRSFSRRRRLAMEQRVYFSIIPNLHWISAYLDFQFSPILERLEDGWCWVKDRYEDVRCWVKDTFGKG